MSTMLGRPRPISEDDLGSSLGPRQFHSEWPWESEGGAAEPPPVPGVVAALGTPGGAQGAGMQVPARVPGGSIGTATEELCQVDHQPPRLVCSCPGGVDR